MVLTGVKKGSAAHRKGVRIGQVIREVGGEAVSSPRDVAKRLGDVKAAGRKPALFVIEADGSLRIVALPLAK